VNKSTKKNTKRKTGSGSVEQRHRAQFFFFVGPGDFSWGFLLVGPRVGNGCVYLAGLNR
jgi:hypothetical protein